jgi:hypothetical protein
VQLSSQSGGTDFNGWYFFKWRLFWILKRMCSFFIFFDLMFTLSSVLA